MLGHGCTLVKVKCLSDAAWLASDPDSTCGTYEKVATCIKDTKFLNFFFRRMRKTTCQDRQRVLSELRSGCGTSSDGDNFFDDFCSYGTQTSFLGDYPFVSPCGKEINFIRPADATPIVFHSLDVNRDLVYGGSLTQPFEEERLRLSKKTGRLYHELARSEKNTYRSS